MPVTLRLLAYGLLFLCLGMTPATPEGCAPPPRPGDEVSPVRGIEPGPDRGPRPDRPVPAPDARSIDGSGNNRAVPEMGASFTPLLRLAIADYADGSSELAGPERPSARLVSNGVSDQSEVVVNELGATDFLWQWGQFVDHDIDLTDGTDPPEPAPIAVPAGDPYFDPFGTGVVEIAFNRSLYDAATGTSGPREQVNEITAWIDASNVYGSDEERSSALRALDGSGRLRTSEGDLLPWNTAGLPNAGGSSDALFLAGDVRANEQVGLIAMHTLFVREHNRQAVRIAERFPEMSGDEIFEHARRNVGALMQVITYREFLPALLGPHALPEYAGYDERVDASISNEFSAAAYRFGHSALSPTLLRLDAAGDDTAFGALALRDAFFAPARIVDEGGIAPILRGLAAQSCQTVDVRIIDDVRNFLFGPPGAGGFDLAALNIQRGRDHGLPSYNDMRRALGLRAAAGFGDVTSDAATRTRLAAVYEDVEEIDLWVGGLAEDAVGSGHVGPLFLRILADQFAALRDGDRFWYARVLPGDDRDRVEATRLSDLIRRNTEIAGEIPDDVFHLPR